jgi:hypothetical protein
LEDVKPENRINFLKKKIVGAEENAAIQAARRERRIGAIEADMVSLYLIFMIY